MSAGRRQAARAFGQALRAARLSRGISQEQLAEKGDFDRTYPSLLERGLRTPTFFVIVSLAEGLNTDPVALFTDAVNRLREQPQSGARGGKLSQCTDVRTNPDEAIQR
jgi:transcriptional regulator with XRE-family HTH domain